MACTYCFDCADRGLPEPCRMVYAVMLWCQKSSIITIITNYVPGIVVSFAKMIAFYAHKLYETSVMVSVYTTRSVNLRDTTGLAEHYTL